MIKILFQLFIYLKRISEAYTFYAKQLEEMEGGLTEEGVEMQESDDPKVEIVRERKYDVFHIEFLDLISSVKKKLRYFWKRATLFWKVLKRRYLLLFWF